jgi:hypothetical protein
VLSIHYNISMKNLPPALRVPIAFAFLISSFCSKAQNLIINPGAESALGSEWHIVSSGTSCYTGSGWRMPSGGNGGGYPNAQVGSYFFNPGCGASGNGATYEIYQDIKLDAHVASIIANAFQISFSAYLHSFDQSPADQASVIVEYRKADSVSVISSFTSGATTYTSGWTLFSKTEIVPTTTRMIRIRLIGTSRNGNAIDSYFDNLVLSPLSLLPIKLVSFTAAANNNNVLLNWESTNEVNNKGFQVQTATDGKNWNTIGFVAASTATSTNKYYTFTDLSPARGGNYYRLVQVDVDGKTQVSETQYVKFGGSSSISIFPNPVKNILNVRTVPANASMTIVNSAGSVVARYSSQSKLDLSSLAPGAYYLKVEDQENVQMLKFMKL